MDEFNEKDALCSLRTSALNARASVVRDDYTLIFNISYELSNMGYINCVTPDDIIMFFEKHSDIDKSQFVFPGGDFDVFKQNVKKHKYDIPNFSMSDEQRLEYKRKLQSGKYVEI